jgi:SAM-dependent methyltransferase
MNFNDYVTDYSKQIEQAVPCVGAKHATFLAEKADQLISLASRHFADPGRLRVLDVGCGIGLMEQALDGRFGRLVGVDVAADAVEKANQSGLDAEFLHYNGDRLPFDDDEFDVAFACCVFHHVPLGERAALTQEMTRVVAPGGLFVIFEHNPWNPLTRLIVSRCEFDRDAILLGTRESTNLLAQAGLKQLTKRQILYFPWRTRFWKFMESLIAWLPLGAQYYVAGSKPIDNDFCLSTLPSDESAAVSPRTLQASVKNPGADAARLAETV